MQAFGRFYWKRGAWLPNHVGMQASSPSSPRTVIIVGGGITGLVAAHELHKQGIAVQLFEKGATLGGSIQTQRQEGWLIESGPNTLLDGDPELQTLIAELGLSEQLLNTREGSKKRFIVRDGRVQALPMSPTSLLTTKLFSWGMRFGIFAEMLQKRRTRPEDVSLEVLVRDHFGQEAVDYGLNPFVSGVYAGDPARLSSKHAFPSLWEAEQTHGSILRGMMAAGKKRKAEGRRRGKIVSFREGLQTLIQALAKRLPPESLHTGSAIHSLERRGDAWGVQGINQAGPFTAEADAVILAVPAHALAGLSIGGAESKPLSVLSQVEHPPVSSLFLGYRREQVSHPLDGFGVLIPAVEKRKELGILFSSSLYDGRAPEGHVALTVMIGGMRQPELARQSPEALLRLVQPDLKELLGVTGEPVFQRCCTWAAAIPQYNLGYGSYLEAIQACEQANPGLHVGGNVRDGISVPNCVSAGLRLAKTVAA
jgi:oxygen-dependent protoporphyrinogen oxidase